MHATKHNLFSVPWVIQPQPSQTEVDCGVFMKLEWEDPLNWTARSPICHAFHPPLKRRIFPPNFRHHKQGRRYVPWPIAEHEEAPDG